MKRKPLVSFCLAQADIFCRLARTWTTSSILAVKTAVGMVPARVSYKMLSCGAFKNSNGKDVRILLTRDVEIFLTLRMLLSRSA